ncbi:MAG: hypothetical protein IAG10_11490 [Planctomycetaceae bacterium]|nr:hypothetical protein [Planctomycetaceae bacterium]
MMKTDDGSIGVEPEKTAYGKVIGVVKNRDQLQAVSEALSKLGVQDVEVLDGAAGIKVLDSEQDAVANCFMGDMEADMVQRYLDAVKKGLIVFAAKVEPETTDQAAETAKARGASEVVHFGDWVITNY